MANTVEGTEVRVTVSGDAYLGQPEMRVLLDGAEIGRLQVAARHAIGEWQTLAFTAPGVVSVGELRIRFVEDAVAPDPSDGDRNLWVAKVEVNGQAIDALAGTLVPEQKFPDATGKPVPQAHGYVLPTAGDPVFDLAGFPPKSENVGPKQQVFDAKFVFLARQVYRLNDRRCELKRHIDNEYAEYAEAGEAGTEPKSYPAYR